MGLLSSSKSSSNTTNKNLTFNNIDYSEGGQSGGFSPKNVNMVIEGNENRITQTDYGAVSAAIGANERVTVAGLDFSQNALDTVTQLATSQQSALAGLVSQANKSDTEKGGATVALIMGVGLAGVAFIAWIARK